VDFPDEYVHGEINMVPGQSRVLFITDKIGFLEIMSVPTLSAAIKKAGHSVEFIEFGVDEAKALDRLETFAADVVAYSVCSNEFERYLGINAAVKNKINCFSVFGGPHPTFFPEFIREPGVDAICRGEGDIALPRLLDVFGTEKMFEVENFSFKTPDGAIRENPLSDLISDLDSLPPPDRDIIYSKSYFQAQAPIKSFFAGRGCPFNCTYCFNHAYHALYQGKGKMLRTKSVRRLIDEIKSVASKYPLKFVKFQDDVFGANRPWLQEFSEMYTREIGLPFLCYARPNMINPTYAQLLKRSGCYSVCMAIESGNEDLRKRILNRNMSDQQILDACRHLKEQGILIYAVNMVGLPGETQEDMLQTLDLNRKAGVDFADASIFQPYPGTKIAEHCKEVGLLDENHNVFESQFTTTVLKLSPDFKAKVETIHRLFSIAVDHPWVEKAFPYAARFGFLKPVLNILYRLYYGICLHKRIYAGAIPFTLRLRGALSLLFSRNRI
jgi:radical SAM superfamily enzyme YgiQ (UPF0313 family)